MLDNAGGSYVIESEKLHTTVGKDLAGLGDTFINPINWQEEVAKITGQLRALHKVSEVKELLRQLDKIPKNQLKIPKKTPMPMNHASGMDVAEVYSPPRITETAAEMNLKEGWAMDLTTVDNEDGLPWDFSQEAKRIRAKEKLEQDKPFMLVASPMCGPFSSLQNWNYAKLSRAEVTEKIQKGIEHVKFCLELCLQQHLAGRLFLFEHPAGASSWESDMFEQLGSLQGVFRTTFDFCTLGMQVKDKRGKAVAPAKKKTRVMTNSHAVHTLLREARCRGDHWHMALVDGKAGPCQEYPKKFCRVIVEGIRREMDTIKWKNKMHQVFDITKPFGKLMSLETKLNELPLPPEEDPFDKLYTDCEFYDDISGAYLDKDLAIKARRLEMDYFRRMGVYTKVRREAWMRIITTKWLDVNKGDAQNPNVRARLVGRELNLEKRDDLFAATPPLESLKAILSICASRQYHPDRTERFIVMILP